MGSYTTKLNLYKPTVGETGWGALVNTNFDTIDGITPAQIGAEPTITKKTAFNKDFGTTSGTVCAGDDERLNNRTPTAHASTHASGGTDAVAIDASQVTSGVLDVGRIPAVALERLVTVADDTARFALTISDVQNGDSVYVTATNKLYIVVDDTKLNQEAGYMQYRAYVSWDSVDNKPSEFTPTNHDASKITSGTIAAARLPAATTSAFGAVKVGSGLSVSGGVISASGGSNIHGTISDYSKGHALSDILPKMGATFQDGSDYGFEYVYIFPFPVSGTFTLTFDGGGAKSTKVRISTYNQTGISANIFSWSTTTYSATETLTNCIGVGLSYYFTGDTYMTRGWYGVTDKSKVILKFT